MPRIDCTATRRLDRESFAPLFVSWRANVGTFRTGNFFRDQRYRKPRGCIRSAVARLVPMKADVQVVCMPYVQRVVPAAQDIHVGHSTTMTSSPFTSNLVVRLRGAPRLAPLGLARDITRPGPSVGPATSEARRAESSGAEGGSRTFTQAEFSKKFSKSIR